MESNATPVASLSGRFYLWVRPHIPDMLQTVFDLAWIAKDVARHARYNGPSQFIDLVAGGNRGFCDQPHLFYCAALFEISPGREYTMRIAPSGAVCIHAVMTSSRNGKSTQTSWSTTNPEQLRQEQIVSFRASPNTSMVLDTTPHSGMCTTFVRIYFLERVGSRYNRTPEVTMTKAGATLRHLIPAAPAALWKFLPLRELTVLRKYFAVYTGRTRPYNVWTLNDVDARRGFRARIKEFLVNHRGRYYTLELSLRRNETMEILYRREEKTWGSLAFVSPETRTLDYMNLSTLEHESDGWIHLKVSPDLQNQERTLCTHGRRIGSLLLREVSIDGRDLPKEGVVMPRVLIHSRA